MLLAKYFPNLSEEQIAQYTRLEELFLDWNQKINLISRRDTNYFEERHVLHSLSIAKVLEFKSGTRILDIGTGGGFPGIPLAIMFPLCDFVLVDSIRKKINVVNNLVEQLELKNVKAHWNRAENINEEFDFVVSRAVTSFEKFMPWVNGKIESFSFNKKNNGILYLKGGDLKEELKFVKKKYEVFPITNFYQEEFFETKKVVYVRWNKK